MRINKYFTEMGICSRREADRHVEDGRVRINGRVAVPGDQVADGDKVELDNVEVVPPPKTPVLLIYNKPVGIECTADRSLPNNLIDAVNYPQRVFYIGRLDVASEGLVLLTNRGDLADRIARSRFGHEREYVVVFDRALNSHDLQTLRDGVDIGDDIRGPTKPCTVEVIDGKRVRLVITEGRNRQIRRMAEALGYRVVRLKRIRVMSIELGDLPRGEWREISGRELKNLEDALEG